MKIREPIELRRAVASDAAAIRALSRAAYANWVALIGREPKPMTADYDRAVALHLIDLWESGGELLALVEMVPKKDHVLIENIAVRPDMQGNGIGALLLRHAETLAARMGLTQTRLYTNAAFAANLAFYTKRGYREDRRQPIVVGGAIVFMCKELRGGE
ncbi:GNAT family N-acetyltransferase [Rhodoblastus sp.]|uniref:GNAT family N-acetyltransferase n=1 Tax=Rhodoblastus sp. TaxID=1962975 RepID=UPI003FD79652